MEKLQTEIEYEAALEEIEILFDAQLDTPDGKRLEFISKLIDQYEEEHYEIKEMELVGA